MSLIFIFVYDAKYIYILEDVCVGLSQVVYLNKYINYIKTLANYIVVMLIIILNLIDLINVNTVLNHFFFFIS